MSQPKSNEELMIVHAGYPTKFHPEYDLVIRLETAQKILKEALAQKDAEVAEALNTGYKLAVKHIKEVYDYNVYTTIPEAIEWLADNARLFTPKE